MELLELLKAALCCCSRIYSCVEIIKVCHLCILWVVSTINLNDITNDCQTSVIYWWIKFNREDKAENEEAKEKMSCLLSDSKLLSTGIKNHHIFFFSKRTKIMIEFLTVSNDNTLLELSSVEKRVNCCCWYNWTLKGSGIY